MKLKGVRVEVVVKDSVGAEPYVAPVFKTSIDGRCMTGFIEARVGAEYWLRCQYGRCKKPRLVTVTVDGSLAVADIIYPRVSSILRVKEADGERNFVFCTPQLGPDGQVDPEKLKQVGSIVATVRDYNLVALDKSALGTPAHLPFSMQALNDNAKAAVLVTSTTGHDDLATLSTTKIQPDNSRELCYVHEGNLVCTFRFQYKTRAGLAEEGIGGMLLPASLPPPPPSELNVVEEPMHPPQQVDEPAAKRVKTELIQEGEGAVATAVVNRTAELVIDLTGEEDEVVPAAVSTADARKEAIRQVKMSKESLGDQYMAAVDLLSRSTHADTFLVVDAADHVEWLRWKLSQ